MSNDTRDGAFNFGLFTFALLFLSSANLAFAESSAASAQAHVIVKSANDERDYAYFVLANKLQVVVISDPDTDKAAAALDVAVGSRSEPTGRQGLAHFLEHMLFLGTEKYPAAGEYQDFITTHGGNHNAYTAFENTNYFFEIEKDHLEPALDRFSQFFLAPTFNAKYVAREKNAVHSEYQSKLKDDRRRTYSVTQQIANPSHPFSKFNVGSLDTLADRDGSEIRAELLKFYERYYSANLMTLTVLGREPLPTLKKWVREKFSAITNRNTSIAAENEVLFQAGRLPARVNVLPISDRRTLMMSFPLPAVKEHYLTAPVSYIANLLGHEGRGSLLSLLKSRGWADSLSAGLGMDSSDDAALAINIALTAEGMKHIDDITTLVFASLRLIDKKGIDAWRFDEQRRLNDIAFRFKQKMPASNYVRNIASDLQHYPPADVLHGPYRLENYSPELIRHFIGYLTPDNVLVTIVALNLPTDSEDPWYGTRYAVTPIDEAVLGRWRDEQAPTQLALPGPNVFIPTRFDLKPPQVLSDIPGKIIGHPGFELWHKQDTNFAQPRADFFVSVRSPKVNDSALHSALTELLVRMVNDNLTEYSYPALLAGLNYDLYQHIRGISIRVSGYDDKQGELLERIFSTLLNPVIDEQRFTALKDDLQRDLKNVKDAPPYEQTTKEIRNLLVRPYWTVDQRLSALESVTANSLRRFIPKMFEKVYVIALSHGNVNTNDSLNLGALVRRSLIADAMPSQVAPGQVVKLRDGDDYLRKLDIEHPDSALSAYIQGTDKSLRTRANFEILGQLTSSPFYNELRTDKQLGYIVFGGSSPYLQVPGVLYVVQSPVADPVALESHITAFVNSFAQQLQSLPDETFAEHKQGLISRLLQTDDRLRTRSNRYWEELDLQRYEFNSRERLAAAIEVIDKQTFMRFYHSALLDKSRKRVLVQALGANHATLQLPESDSQIIKRPEKFGRDRGYFPATASGELNNPSGRAAVRNAK